MTKKEKIEPIVIDWCDHNDGTKTSEGQETTQVLGVCRKCGQDLTLIHKINEIISVLNSERKK